MASSVLPINQPLPVITTITIDHHEQGTPMWWADRLHRRLLERQNDIQLYRRYADGDHDDPSIEAKASRAFRRIVGLSKTNLSGLIVEATAERMAISGFRFGDDEESDAADKDAWAIWQASDFDYESNLLINESLTVGRSFILAEPPGINDKYPKLYGEDASQMIIAYAPGRRSERLAAWKEWKDEWTGDVHGTLYLPDKIVKLMSKGRPTEVVNTATLVIDWQYRNQEVESERNPFGEVPVWEMPNRPQLAIGSCKSELADVIGDQDACNHIALNALIAAEYGAFRQKWATGLAVPRNPDTGEAIEPFDVAVNRMLVSENDAARFGDFTATDLIPYITLYESRVKHMAAVTRTPVAMLLGGMVNVSAEALALSVAGLVQKVKRKARYVEQPAEAALRACFKLMGDPRANATIAETIWVDPEIRSAAQQADAAVKLVSGNVVSRQTAQELYLGMSKTQRDRDKQWFEDESEMRQLTESILQANSPDVTARDLANDNPNGRPPNDSGRVQPDNGPESL